VVFFVLTPPLSIHEHFIWCYVGMIVPTENVAEDEEVASVLMLGTQAKVALGAVNEIVAQRIFQAFNTMTR